jgi:general secretion pathway protein E
LKLIEVENNKNKFNSLVEDLEKIENLKPSSSSPASVNMPRLNVLRQAPTPEALQSITEEMAQKYKVVPLSIENNTLRVAIANSSDVLTIEALQAITKKRIEVVPATEADIQEAIDFNYRAFSAISNHFSNVEVQEEAASADALARDAADDSPVAQALMLIIEEAVKSRASDIHFEPEADRFRIRYRIDGILHDVISLPIGVHLSLISRIKILSNMNIADRIRPQDGQFSVEAKGKSIDIRVANINTVHGEMSVLRLLDKSLGTKTLSQIGFLPESQEKFEKILMSPYGMVVVSGPTGAGKTTTLYAAVNSLDRVKNNIITIEDPVEYRFPNINQIQVNPRAGLTFASGLRSIVRLDPDVILVGEIRDKETSEIAVQSALTGHLVLSSVHANDTTGVLFRLMDLGVEPFLISSSVIGIIAQRMVRRVCPYCAQSVPAPLVERMAYQQVLGEQREEFVYGAGCKACVYTGYLGRTGIFEILMITDSLRQMIVDRAPSSLIRAQAIKEGLVNIAQDGMLKVKQGITTPYEVLRNAQIGE